jgi:hyperosmotically inducible protein
MKALNLDISLCVAGALSVAAIVAVYAANPTTNLRELEASAPQTASLSVDDAAITSNVLTAINSDPQTASLRLNIGTRDGVVAVRGSVPNAHVGAHLLQVVATVEGVRGVKNSLRIAILS